MNASFVLDNYYLNKLQITQSLLSEDKNSKILSEATNAIRQSGDALNLEKQKHILITSKDFISR